MEDKIDLILAAQDTPESNIKELKKDIKQLKADVGLLPKIQDQMKTVKTDITTIKSDVNTNKASIVALEACIKELTDANEAIHRDLKWQHSPNPSSSDSSLQEKIAEQVRCIGKKKQLILEGIAKKPVNHPRSACWSNDFLH